jgi:ADP-ribosyl-[dinitrogen reductase] hydrolase
VRPDRRTRFEGCFIGLAVGDALGTTLEFTPPGGGRLAPLAGMAGGGPFGLAPGQWTDDTSMALCLAESLIACDGFDPKDQLERYLRWWQLGENSSTGICFDIGSTTATALRHYQLTGQKTADVPSYASNGSLMRLAPAILRYADAGATAEEMAAASSRTTHSHADAVAACRYLARLVVGALSGAEKHVVLEAPATDLTPTVAEVAAGSYLWRDPPAIRGTGQAVRCLEAALWAFHRTETFADAVLAAANLGEDADTTAAVCGQLAGAYYGVGGVPAEWRTVLQDAAKITRLADQLFGASERRY